ncbi:hypothetical protein D3C71_1529280 [compost metagenome]
MLVVAVPRIDQRNGYLLGELLQHTGRFEADDAGIDAHRFQGADCVVDRFALLDA